MIGVSLYEADLTGGVNLYEADLTGAFLDGAVIQANLIHSRIQSLDFSAVDLSRGVTLWDTDVRGVDFSNRDLGGSDLRSADLSTAILDGADLSRVRWDESTRWPTEFDPAAYPPNW